MSSEQRGRRDLLECSLSGGAWKSDCRAWGGGAETVEGGAAGLVRAEVQSSQHGKGATF